MRRLATARLGGAALALALALLAATSANAATFEVTKRSDPAPGPCTPADCSLREAVIAANTSLGESDRIVLPRAKRYRLTIPDAMTEAASGDLDVNNDGLQILHPGRGRATIEQEAADRVLDVANGAPLTLRKVVVTGGSQPTDGSYGGGIRAVANLTVVKSVIRGNSAGSCGGGIHTQTGTPLVLRRSSVVGNEAGSDAGGVSHSCFGSGGQLTMVRSTIARNRSDANSDGIGRGGGMYFQTGDFQSRITDSTIARNNTGPGGHMFGASEGGGIYADLGQLRITDTTISDNRTGDGGGGISLDGTEPLVITNSTIAGNRAKGVGGGISMESRVLELNAVTVARNLGNSDGLLSEAGGGIFNGENTTFRVENSLIALNRLREIGGGGTLANDCSSVDPFESLGHNLLSTRFLCEGEFEGPGDRARANPRIGRLDRNGGPTETIALEEGSPAIGGALRSSAPPRDQRGRKRDRRPDIGAFER